MEKRKIIYMEKGMESFFNQEILKRYYIQNISNKEILKTLVRAWKEAGTEDVFLILYVQVWLNMEDAYMQDVERFYNEEIYEKELFFELLEYRKLHMKKSKKLLLVTGYIYTATDYFFWGNCDLELGQIEKRGKEILAELERKYPDDFAVKCFCKHDPSVWKKNICGICDNRALKERIYTLFPSDIEVDVYFREVMLRKFNVM